MEIDGLTFVPNSGYFLLIWVKACLKKLAFFLLFEPILPILNKILPILNKMLAPSNKKSIL